MARTIADIKTGIGNAYMGLLVVQTLYSLTPADITLGFDALFSMASVESILFYAIAFAINLFELIMDAFRIEIQTKIDGAFVGNKAWWHAQGMAFQKGYNLVLNTKTFEWAYETIDLTAQIIKHVAVRETVQSDGSCKVKLLVATENAGTVSALIPGDLNLFSIYCNQKKFSGVLLQIISDAGDVVDFSLTVNYNALLLTSAGLSILNGNYPVNDAITGFITTLNNSTFGGDLNLTKLIDSIQIAEGVIDAKITQLKINGVIQTENWGTYESTNGWFSLGLITAVYQPQLAL